MKRVSPEEQPEAGIDISPLIDMVFILLIFFMVSTTFVKDMQVDIDRPAASSSKASQSEAIRIFIDASEKIFVDGSSVNSWILQSKIREKSQKSKEASILIMTDKSVSADKLIEVVDSCRLAGVKDIGVATEGEI